MSEIDDLKAELRALRREVELLKRQPITARDRAQDAEQILAWFRAAAGERGYDARLVR